MGQNLFGYTHEGDHLEITNCMKESTGMKYFDGFIFCRNTMNFEANENSWNFLHNRFCEIMPRRRETVEEIFLFDYREN